LLLAAMAVAWASGAAAQTLSDQRLYLVPTHVTRGTGTVRLDGMGGFEAVVSDENYELNAYDFSGNPAAFGDDRDSWSIDMRYTHHELVERGASTAGNDIKINDGVLFVGYHAPGNVGVGGIIDYAEVTSGIPIGERKDYQLAGLELLLSKYLFEKLTVGVNVSQRSEEEGVFSPEVYKISHDNTVTRGGLGAEYLPVPGVAVGIRGELVSTQLDGTSRGPFHTDLFDWSRPGGLVSVHGFVNRGRVEAGVDYTRQKIEGEETVVISWSERFQFNPITDTYHHETDTFTEDRVDEGVRARAKLNVIPGRLAVAAAVQNHKRTAEVTVNPNVLGSELAQDLETTLDSVVGGVSWTGLQSRLLVAAELKIAKLEVDGTIDDHPVGSTNDLTLYRLGGEYLVGETLVGRAGLTQAQESLEFVATPDLNGDFNSTYVAVGLGVVPAGAIWQLDIAYDVAVSSDLDTDRSRFSAYVKYLF
jgi:hypothetical protein